MKFFEISFLKSHFENPHRGFLRKSEQKTPMGIFLMVDHLYDNQNFPYRDFLLMTKKTYTEFHENAFIMIFCAWK